MAQRSLPRIPADVLWWNDSTVVLECPFCDNIHSHGSLYSIGQTFDYSQSSTRIPHCHLAGPLQSYFFRFPLGKYEIDKERFRYTVLDKQRYPHVFSDELSGSDFTVKKLTDPLHDLLHEDHCSNNCPAIWNIDRNGKRCSHVMAWFWSFCVTNSFRELKVLLGNNSKDFVNTIDGERNTGLHLAAMEGHTQTIEFLHDQGSRLNAKNSLKRTPLMEASLWGRWEAVRYLLLAGAELHHRDTLGRDAQDLALDDLRNIQARRAKSPLLSQTLSEREKIAFSQRNIYLLLCESTRGKPPTATESGPTNRFKFISSLHQTELIESRASWPVSSPKTVAILQREGSSSDVSAHSGWVHQETRVGEHGLLTLGGQEWTIKVLDLCKFLEYELVNHDHDGHRPGAYYACHAEMQLMTYFISRHVILDHEKTGWLEKLAAIEPDKEERPRKATIIVSKPPCEECRRFREHILQRVDVDFTIAHRAA